MAPMTLCYNIHSSMVRRSMALALKKVPWKNHSSTDRRQVVSRESFQDSPKGFIICLICKIRIGALPVFSRHFHLPPNWHPNRLQASFPRPVQFASELASQSASGNWLRNWPLNRPLASLSACFSPEKNQASLLASGQ